MLALGLFLPLGSQTVFILNHGPNLPKYRFVLPAIFPAGISDRLLIIMVVVGESNIIMFLPVLPAFI
ncbi:LysE family L-lysine exporter, partial [Staphylococcus aureus]